jgi:hypothetical protein
VPTTASTFFRSANFSTHSLAMIHVDVEVTLSRNQALGSLSVNFTACLSSTSILSIDERVSRLPLPLMVRYRL